MNKIKRQDFKGFETQSLEKTINNLPLSGDIPAWLSGCFVSNGPAQFEVGETHFNSWLDGFAMLKKFDFHGGEVDFQNRYLRSQQYVKSNAAKKLYSDEFDTYASPSFIGRIAHVIKSLVKGGTYDNCNVNTMRQAEHFLAMTESNNVIEFSLNDLSTIGQFQFNDQINAQMVTAHPHWDAERNETITVAIEIGKEDRYHICKIAGNSTQREIIKSVVPNNLFYMHTFSITPNYVILFQSPLVLNKFKLMLGLPFNSALSWQKNQTSLFIIVDRRTGEQTEIEHDPFICLHSANAYENNDEIILDLVCYQGGENIYSDLLLGNLRSEHPDLHSGNLRRFVLNRKSKLCQESILSNDNQEFPRIHYKSANGKKYEYVYTNLSEPNARFYNAIQKLNVQTGNAMVWKKENYFPGEPVFVPKPGFQSEDDGVLLSIGYQSDTQISSLIVLDAKSMQQIAEAALPIYLPLGLHGNFFST